MRSRLVLGTVLVLLALLLSYGDWSYTHGRDLSGLPFAVSTLLLMFSGSIFGGAIFLMAQELSRTEQEFKTAGKAASVFFGLGLTAGGAMLLILAALLLDRAPEQRGWAASFFVLGTCGSALGLLAFLRPCFTSGWRPAEVETFIPPQEDARPVIPPDPDLGGLLQVKRKLRELGRV